MIAKKEEACILVFNHWPSSCKMDMNCGILDSRSIYVILVPWVSVGVNIADVVYTWIGLNLYLKEN